ncbi:hypothetical protein RND71_009653 [Anisodus tanguticus]|uniref:Uncharacterized protein n=1 Tax=Anisodus tanguticus TaxID=243964 RepID=A0AAE1VHE6_9SOLA|nr:hypothetical protein RND71_009653 [Anisodus tanguticus]
MAALLANPRVNCEEMNQEESPLTTPRVEMVKRPCRGNKPQLRHLTYKPIDIEKKKSYLSWINMRSDQEHIGYTLIMDFRWFKNLSRPGSWLTDDHVTEIMALMRSCSIDYPKYYDPSDIIMDVFSCSALMAIYNDIVVKSATSLRSIKDVLNEYEFNDQILDYVTGDHPQPFGICWVGAERMFCV